MKIVAVALITVCGIFSVSSTSYAQGEKLSVTLLGVGIQSCGKFIESRNDKTGVLIFNSWLGGFLTGSNAARMEYRDGSRGVLEDHDVSAYFAWVEKYCRDNPLDTYAIAARRLMLELISRSRER